MERAAHVFRFGTAEFDEARCELRVAGLPVEVERRALEVLIYLLRHAGEVVTKDELLSEVWAGRVTVDKVLPNAINKLRRALGEANAGHVATLARIGYRLDGPISRTAVSRQVSSELELFAGCPAPKRENFILQRQLARTAGSEVWLAEHRTTREVRVYKYGLDHDRLRALKRETTLLRVLQESLEDRTHFVDIIDWSFESAPYFLECAYGGDSLAEWAAEHLAALSDTQRIELFLQIVDAVAAAHSVGVLHKDLKPANVLVSDHNGQPHVRLTDFGSGRLLDAELLAKLGITRLGLTVTESVATDASSGTPLYVAPEVFAGQTPTVQSDVFALGILLYQLLSGHIGRPMVSGWEQYIRDPLLQEDIQRATDGNPSRRLASAADLAVRLRRLDARREEAEQLYTLIKDAERTRSTLARAEARRPIALALIVALIVGFATAIIFQQLAVRARNEARDELARATAITRFVNEDLIGRSNPLVNTQGADAKLKDLLLAARGRVSARFAAQPLSEAAIRHSLATVFNAIDLWPEAEVETQRALALFVEQQGPRSPEALSARALLVSILSRLGKQAEASEALDELTQLAGDDSRAASRYALASASSTYLISRGDYANAASQLRTAVTTLTESEPDATALLDMLRVNLIATLAISGSEDEAKRAADTLIADATARSEDAALTIALAKIAVVRAYGEDHVTVERLLMEAQPVIVERLGADHSRHLQLLGELLGLALRRGDLTDGVRYAEQLHLQALAKFGDQHPTTYVTLGNWGRLLAEAGQPEAAAVHLRRARAKLLTLVGPEAASTHDLSQVLAAVELELGNTESASALVDSLDAEILERGRATGLWPATIDVMRGMLLQRGGDADAARSVLVPALAQLASEEDLDHPSRLYQQAQATLVKVK